MKFIKHEVTENGITNTNYFINEEPVAKWVYEALEQDDFEKYKNIHIKDEINNDNNSEINDSFYEKFDDQYIQALEDDYRDSDFETIETMIEQSEKCAYIMDMVQDIRDSETDEEAFNLLSKFVNRLENRITTMTTFRNQADNFNQKADDIESRLYCDEEFEEED